MLQNRYAKSRKLTLWSEALWPIMFRVIIPKLTRNSDESSNEWHFNDPLYPTKYVMKITRQYDLGPNDSL